MRSRQLWQLGLPLVMAVILGSAAMAQTPQEKKNQEMAMTWYRDVVVQGHVNDASKYMADDYVDHDPKVLGGRSKFIQHFENAAERPAEAKLVTSFGQGDYVVMVWSRADKDPKTSTPYNYTTYDVVRLKNGKIQEHWNNGKKNSQWH